LGNLWHDIQFPRFDELERDDFNIAEKVAEYSGKNYESESERQKVINKLLFDYLKDGTQFLPPSLSLSLSLSLFLFLSHLKAP